MVGMYLFEGPPEVVFLRVWAYAIGLAAMAGLILGLFMLLK